MPVYLRNELLEVEIGEPGELYTGSRFDHSGNIVQVTLNKKHTFCSTEKPNYSQVSGFGLMNEFNINEPIGYNETNTGEWFVKIGVGYLLKPNDKPYDFFNLYDFEPFVYFVDKKSDCQISFETESRLINGYRFFYRKMIQIEGPNLFVNYQLRNIGMKEMAIEEYCHNFLAIDKMDITKDYDLEFNFDLLPINFAAVVDPLEILEFATNTVSWKQKPSGDFFIAEMNGKKPTDASWRLLNHRSKVGMSERVTFMSSKVNLWGNGHVVSPEMFFSACITPGGNANWQREYSFFEI